ncbi:MAG: hypothetical protein COT74_12550 [Bdellovibrionales bacterium CG10_big_fil_rev_8_21_14_0_10_45_34]|nr:MAG: hypothetical protein COT74_12550 [Bdellovibrionales bacterium CG10_big_fil_rev_8_21_14_0_10_45_34]
MSVIRRYLLDEISKDALAQGKIAFISGPRQVGKTTMTQTLLKELRQEQNYFTWDDDEFRKAWTKDPKSLIRQIPRASLVVLDEIHKDRKWKSKIKGIYDLLKNDYKFIVTGSARLDYFRKSGDSLQGRYLPYRLHPFTLGETNRVKPPPEKDWDELLTKTFSLSDLINYGGFPEPQYLQDQKQVQRWQRLYRERMIREDLRDLQEVRDVRQVETLAILLQEKAAGQLSYESLREDLSVSFETVKRWIDLLETLYYSYRIPPYSKAIRYSLKKEPKIFLYDWSLAQNQGAKFENLVAGHLLKSCHAWTDCAMGEFQLFYLRDKLKREVDFLITKDSKAFALVEVKSGESEPTPALLYYQKILKPDFCIQVVRNTRKEKGKLLQHPGVQVLSAERFLGSLN